MAIIFEWLLWPGLADDSLLSFQKCVCLYSMPYGLPARLFAYLKPHLLAYLFEIHLIHWHGQDFK